MAHFEDEKDMSNSPGLLYSKVFIQIENNILNGKYKSGHNFTEKGLAEELGVSRTPVREALRQLELEGLVKSIPNKGVTVVGISEQDIEDIYYIKMSIEGLAARLAAQRIDEAELSGLEEIVDLTEFYLKKNDFERLLLLDSQFHETIFRASKNWPLKNMLRNLHNYVKGARINSLSSPGRANKMLEEHRRILNAIKEKNPDKAEELTKQHIANTMKNLHEVVLVTNK